MNIGDLELAEQCFLLADELQPSQALQTTILDIQKQLASKQKPATVTISEHGRTLLANARRKMKDGNLKDAIDLYKQIPARDQKHESVEAFKQELDTRIRKNVTQGIELGRKLYSQGEIKQALAVWNDVRELDPKNQHLISYINRAERVLNKLEQLQKENTTVKPPENKEPNS
jgi:tetratricopeptide (TPR) repeat protein